MKFIPCVFTSLALAASSPAQVPVQGLPPAESQPPAAQSPVLAGPPVTPGAALPGIVAFDFNGSVRRHDTTPEQAAVERLALGESVMSAVRRVLDHRDAVLDSFVATNIDLLVKFGAAAGGNDKLDQAALGLEAFQKLAPLREGGSLWEQVRAALPAERAKKFDRFMTEYWDAIVAEGKRTRNEQGKERTRFEIVAQERLAILGKEIERSFARQQYSGGIIVGYFTQDLELTDAQKARVRQMSLGLALGADMEATEKQQQQILVELMSILDEPQRAKVMKRLGL